MRILESYLRTGTGTRKITAATPPIATTTAATQRGKTFGIAETFREPLRETVALGTRALAAAVRSVSTNTTPLPSRSFFPAPPLASQAETQRDPCRLRVKTGA